MTYIKIIITALKELIFFIIFYLAIYGISWIGFLKIAKKDLIMGKTFTLENLLDVNKIAFEYANNFIYPFILFYLIIKYFKFIKKTLFSFFPKKNI